MLATAVIFLGGLTAGGARAQPVFEVRRPDPAILFQETQAKPAPQKPAVIRDQVDTTVAQLVCAETAPICELRRVAGNVTSANLRIELNKPNQPYRIRADNLVFRVYAPFPREGYLSVAFLNADGTARQFRPWTEVQLWPGGWATFGDKVEISLDPPAGKLVIVAVMSSQRLFADAPPELQASTAYLAALKQALALQPNSIVNYVVIDTVH